MEWISNGRVEQEVCVMLLAEVKGQLANCVGTALTGFLQNISQRQCQQQENTGPCRHLVEELERASLMFSEVFSVLLSRMCDTPPTPFILS